QRVAGSSCGAALVVTVSAVILFIKEVFFFSSRRRHTRSKRDWSSDMCSSISLAEVARQVVVDARVQLDLDLAAALAHRLRVAGLEQLGRELAPGGLLAQHLKRGPRPVLGR